MKLHQILWYLLILLLPVQVGKHFWPNFSLVNGIRIDYLSPTLYLTDILIVGIIGNWLFNKCKAHGAKRIVAKRNFFLFLGFFVFLLVNCLFSKNPDAAFYQLVKIFEFVSLGIYIKSMKYSVSSIQFPLSLAVLYSSLIAIAQFIKQGSLSGIFYWLGERTFTIGTPGIARTIIDGQLFLRTYATFPHPNVLAGFLLISLILTFSYWKKRSIKLLTVYLVISITAIILTFSRTVWLVGLLTMLSAVIANTVKQSRTRLPRSLRSLAMTISVILMCIIILFLFKKPSNIFQEESFTRRVELNNAATQMIQQSPIFGIGLNNFIIRLSQQPVILGSTYWLQPVHNIFLLIAAETGLVGLFIFLYFLLQTLSNFRLGSTAESRRVSLLTSIAIILFLGLFDHYWLTLQQGQLLFTIAMGISWSKIKA